MAARILNWLFTGLVAAALVIAAVPVLFFLLIILEPRPDYDDDDPRYTIIVDELSRVRDEWRRGVPRPIDIASLNGGNWTMACLYGGFNDPLHDMRGLGGRVSPADEKRLEALEAMGFRLDTVEELEAMVAFVDSGNNAHFAHFKYGLGVDGQHFRRCVRKPETLISLY
jgi:hypothetical protein